MNAREKDHAVAVTFNEATRRLLDGRNFATVATVNPDGAPHASVVWVTREGDTVLFSITTGRQKARNLARDPRVSVAVRLERWTVIEATRADGPAHRGPSAP